MTDIGFSCSRCLHHFCPALETDAACVYTITRYMPFVQGNFKSQRPVEFTYHSSRKQMLTRYFHEVEEFRPHYDYCSFHKKVMKTLFRTFPNSVLICRWDFIQNVELKRGTEIAQTYYSRKQVGFLVNTVYFRTISDRVAKHSYEYFMDFLQHSSLVFHKCMDHFMNSQFDFPDYITSILMLSDGAGKEFCSRHNMIWGCFFERKYGFKFRMCIDPPYHGKGDCDSRGGVIKRGLLRHIVKPGVHVDTAHDLVAFVNTEMHDTIPGSALFIEITARDREILGIYVKGINSHYDYIFARSRLICHWRKYPCFCHRCIRHDYDACINVDFCGPLLEKRVRREGTRAPRQILLDNTACQPQLYEPHVNVGFNARNFQWEVNRIISKRTSHGSAEYLVDWVDWDTDTWVAASDLVGSQRFIDAFEATFCLPNVVALSVSVDSDVDSDVDSSSVSVSSLQPAVQQQHQISIDESASLNDSQDYWEVEEILLRRVNQQGITEYYVKWVGYDDDVNTWVIETDLHCPELLRAFNDA